MKLYCDSVFQVDEEQMTKILSMIDSGKTEGGKLLYGGNRVGEKGYFVAPTVFADVRDDMKIAREEVRNFYFVFFKKVNEYFYAVIIIRHMNILSLDLWTSAANFEIR